MSEWISVTERLPGVDEEVWCYSNKNGGYMFIGYIGYHTRDWIEHGVLHIGDVTHWMPLPEPPVAVAENATTTATDSKTERVRCADCKHLMFSDCYGECSAAYRGIVRPDDTCPHGVRRADDD